LRSLSFALHFWGSALSPLTPGALRRQQLLIAAGETGTPSTRRPGLVQAGAERLC